MRTNDPPLRRGITNLEVVVAASLLVVTIGTLASIAPRLGRLWRTTRNHQLALDELTNRLEYITSLPESEQKDALESMQVSPALNNALQNAKLAHRWLEDEYGKRIELSIDWERGLDSKPLTLVAWVQNRRERASQEQVTDATHESENNSPIGSSPPTESEGESP